MDELTDAQIEEFCSLLHYKPATDGTLNGWLEVNAPGMSSGKLSEKLISDGRVKRFAGYPPLVLL